MLKPRATACAHGAALGPGGLQLRADRLQTGAGWQASFAVIGYPHEVSRGWLGPLLQAARDTDLALHVEPLPAQIAADRLRRQRARFESTRRLERDRGQLPDPFVAAAAEDSEELMGRLARGQSKLFRAGLYLSVQAASESELAERVGRLRALCSSLLLHLVPASFRPFEGWLSTLPLGLDQLRLRRSFDTEALAASYPVRRRRSAARPERYPLRAHPLRRADPAGSVRGRQLQHGAARPLAAPARATRQARSAAAALPRRAGVRDRPRERVRTPHPRGRRRPPPPRRHRRGHAQPARPPGRRNAGQLRRARALPHRTRHPAPRRAEPARSWRCSTGRSAPATPPPASAPTRPRTAGRRRCCATSPQHSPPTPMAARLAERLQPYASGSHAKLFSQPTAPARTGSSSASRCVACRHGCRPPRCCSPWTRLGLARGTVAEALRARRRGLAADARTRRRPPSSTGSRRARASGGAG